MNHPIDPKPETDPRVHSKQLKLLEALIDKIIEGLEDNSCRPKVRDALLAIKLQKEVAKTSEAEETFWGLIDNIRDSELSEPDSLEAQIKRTISSLAHQVKNGILPVKVITDAFNQSRFEQARLTYRRMSGLLSAMGFTKVRASNGARAIIWDDNRLSGTPKKGAFCTCPPDKEVHPEDRQGVVLCPPDIEDPQGRRSVGKGVHPEDHQGAILSPPDKGAHSQDHQGAVLSPPDKGDLGGYDENVAPAKDAGDCGAPFPDALQACTGGVCQSRPRVEHPTLPLAQGGEQSRTTAGGGLVLSPPDKRKSKSVGTGGSCFVPVSPPRPGVKP